MKNILVLFFIAPCYAWANVYVDISGGVLHRQLKGDTYSYQDSQSLTSEVSIGHLWKQWDLSIDGLYSVTRQKKFKYSYDFQELEDDYNWHSVSVGPTLKYNILSKSKEWSWAPFLGLFYNISSYGNSSELTDNTTGEQEDNSHETWGYGGKLGVQFKTFAKTSSWLESVSYKVFGSYTKYKKTEGNYYNSSSQIKEYHGDTPDNLHNYSIGILVGLSFGDKLYDKVKAKIGF